MNLINYIKLQSFSFLSWIFIVLFSFASTKFFINWHEVEHPFIMDVDQYYSYLNALFIDHDLTFKNTNHQYWLMETPTNFVVPKVTYGVAFFYSPFYLLAKLFSASSSNGYEPIYAWFIHVGCMAYILAGLNFVRKILLSWFSEIVTGLSVLILFFATNLFYYTVSESESVHGILFFLISGFFYYVIDWHLTRSKKSVYLFSLLFGFICLIRPTEFILLLFPLLIGVSSTNGLKLKCLQILELKWHLLIVVLIFLAPIIPQLLYWNMQSGSYFFFSYGSSEGFFWADPKFLNVLLSYKKGWLVYTPVMIFSLIGFILLYKKNKTVFWPIILYFLINLYLISAWWDWAFGGSFGMRALIQTYVFLVIPLAHVIQKVVEVSKRKTVVYSFSIIILFFTALNVLQSNLYKHGIIDYDGMTKEAYWYTFMKKKYTVEDLQYLKTLVKHPDYEARRMGNRDE